MRILTNKPAVRLSLGLTAAALALGAGVAYAGSSASSAVGYFGPVGGYYYQNQASINVPTAPTYPTGTTYLGPDTNTNQSIPAGYEGYMATIYEQDSQSGGGTLCGNGPWYTNGSAIPNGQWNSVSYSTNCPDNYLFSQGYNAAWDGSSWHYYTTLSTPLVPHG